MSEFIEIYYCLANINPNLLKILNIQEFMFLLVFGINFTGYDDIAYSIFGILNSWLWGEMYNFGRIVITFQSPASI